MMSLMKLRRQMDLRNGQNESSSESVYKTRKVKLDKVVGYM